MSTIILRGADFSENNIGKIDLQLPFDVLTKSTLSRNGIVIDETNLFQKELDRFFNTLRRNGLVGDSNAKIKSLCLPFLSTIAQSGDTAYAQLNVLNGENFFTTDIQGSLSVVSKGLAAVPDAASKNINLTPYVTYDDYHLSAYNITNEPYAQTGPADYFSKFMIGSQGRTYGLVKNYGAHYPSPFVYINISDRLTGDANYGIVPCLHIANFTTKVNLFVNGQKTERETPTFPDTSLRNPKFLVYTMANYTDDPSAESNKGYSKASYSVISLGKSLTDEQSVIFNNAVNDLMSAVNAYL